ncbi:MAG: hypothetical protein KAI79_05985 [Bacteroidales bacterium]|nr:hypothetical protein [Bacteroidales bacterium]
MIKEALNNINERKSTSHVLVWNLMDGDIPLTPKMMQRIFPNDNKKYYFHTLEFDDIHDLEKLQNTKKQISAFSNFTTSDIFRGPFNGPQYRPVIAVLHGKYTMSFPEDIWSDRDRQGKRWISRNMAQNIQDVKLKEIVFKISDEIREYINKTYDPTSKDWARYSMERIPQGKERNEFLKNMFDVAEKILLKHKKAFSEAINNAEYGGKTHHTYDEVIAHSFKIVEILIPPYDNLDDAYFEFMDNNGIKHTNVSGDNDIKRRLKKYKDKA